MEVWSRGCQRFAEGMGLGMKVELDGRRDRSVGFDSDGTGRQNRIGRAKPAGTRAMQWGGKSPIEG